MEETSYFFLGKSVDSHTTQNTKTRSRARATSINQKRSVATMDGLHWILCHVNFLRIQTLAKVTKTKVQTTVIFNAQYSYLVEQITICKLVRTSITRVKMKIGYFQLHLWSWRVSWPNSHLNKMILTGIKLTSRVWRAFFLFRYEHIWDPKLYTGRIERTRSQSTRESLKDFNKVSLIYNRKPNMNKTG